MSERICRPSKVRVGTRLALTDPRRAPGVPGVCPGPREPRNARWRTPSALRRDRGTPLCGRPRLDASHVVAPPRGTAPPVHSPATTGLLLQLAEPGAPELARRQRRLVGAELQTAGL